MAALGPAGRARGEDHQADVVQRGACQSGCGLRPIVSLKLLPKRDHIGKVMQTLAWVAAQATRVNHHDGFQVGQAVPHGQHLVKLFLILTDDDGRFRQGQQVFDLKRWRCRVDPGGDATDHGHTKLGKGPFLAVFAQHRHTLPRHQTQLQEAQATPA